MSYVYDKVERDLLNDKIIIGEKGISPAVDAAYKRNIVRSNGRAAKTSPFIQEPAPDRFAIKKMTSSSLNMREKFAIGGQFHAHKDSPSSHAGKYIHDSGEIKRHSLDFGSSEKGFI